MYGCVQGTARGLEGKPLLSPTSDHGSDNEDAISEELSPEQ